jgi:hypothetical protein
MAVTAATPPRRAAAGAGRRPRAGIGLLALTCLLPMPAMAAAGSAPAAAAQLLAATPPEARGDLSLAFDATLRADWHYTPRRRDGLPWKAMSAPQREATLALLRSALTDEGLAKLQALFALEGVLRALEGGNPGRDPDNYAVALYGRPGDEGWGWRIEGHHLSLHFSLQGERYVSTLPQFFGANPAVVPHGGRAAQAGLPAGFRLLGREEDLARRWLAGLDPAQRRIALIDDRPYGDIVSRAVAQAQPLSPAGLAFEAMTPAQQDLLLQLVAGFAEHLQPALAEARLARVRASAPDRIRVAWAGSTTPGEPHYFRIQGEGFLIEYDNSGGNHVHSVWRDFDGDFGRDVLRDHYERARRR